MISCVTGRHPNRLDQCTIERVERIELSSSEWKSDIISHYTTPAYMLSGWQDSNLRPRAPKARAITWLRYTPWSVFRDISYPPPQLGSDLVRYFSVETSCCPDRVRTYTLLDQNQTCCQLHYRTIKKPSWKFPRGPKIFMSIN